MQVPVRIVQALQQPINLLVDSKKGASAPFLFVILLSLEQSSEFVIVAQDFRSRV